MSMGIYNLPRGNKTKNKKTITCARLHFIETYNVQTENRNANTAAAVKPTGIKKKKKKKDRKKKEKKEKKRSNQMYVEYSSS